MGPGKWGVSSPQTHIDLAGVSSRESERRKHAAATVENRGDPSKSESRATLGCVAAGQDLAVPKTGPQGHGSVTDGRCDLGTTQGSADRRMGEDVSTHGGTLPATKKGVCYV